MNTQLRWVIVIALGIFLLLVVMFFGARAKPPSNPKRRKITDDPTEEDCDKVCQYILDNPGLGINMCEQQACRESPKFAPYCVCVGELAACEASKTTVAGEIITATEELVACEVESAGYPTVVACQEAISVTDMCEVTTGVLPNHFSSFLVVYRSGTGIIFNTAKVNGDRLGNRQDGKWEDVGKNAEKWDFERVMFGNDEYWHITPNGINWPYAIGVGEPGDSKVYIVDYVGRNGPYPDEELWKFSTNSHGQVPQITCKAQGFEAKYLEQDTGNWKLVNNPTEHPFNFFPDFDECTGSVLRYKSGASRAIVTDECDGHLAACKLELAELTQSRDDVLESLRVCQDHIATPITVATCQAKHAVTDMCVFSQGAASKNFTGRLYTVWNSQSVIKIAGWYADEALFLMIDAQNRSNSDMRLLYFTHIEDNRYHISLERSTYYLSGSLTASQQPFFVANLLGQNLEWNITGVHWNLTIQNVNTGFYLYKDHQSEGTYPIDYGLEVNSAFNGWSLNNVLTDFECAPSVPRYK